MCIFVLLILLSLTAVSLLVVVVEVGTMIAVLRCVT